MGNTETVPVDGEDGPIGVDHDGGGEDYDPFDGIDTLGYRVLGVQPNSPASKAGLVSFLDFLVGANRKMLLGSGEELQEGEEYDDVDLPGLLQENKGKSVEFLVWNIKSQQTRLVDLTPNDDWGGAGLLGVTIRLDNYAGAEDRLIRVLTVEDQSPAAVAGLVPQKDFLLGSAHQTLENTQTLATILQHYEDRVVELYVYNCDSDLVRVVALMPTLSWGGQGLLGAEVGIGYLHRLPSTVRNTEGASVERKVRYVTNPAVVGGGGDNKTNGGSGGNTGGAVAATSSTGAGGATILEMEPQLEMEPAPHDDHDQNENDISGDMSSVALASEAGDDSAADSSPTGAEQQQQQQQSQQARKEPEGGSNGTGQQQAQQQHQQDEKTTQAGEATTSTSNINDEGGDAPPPPAAATAANPNFLPPPPKMDYATPPREGHV